MPRSPTANPTLAVWWHPRTGWSSAVRPWLSSAANASPAGGLTAFRLGRKGRGERCRGGRAERHRSPRDQPVDRRVPRRRLDRTSRRRGDGPHCAHHRRPRPGRTTRAGHNRYPRSDLLNLVRLRDDRKILPPNTAARHGDPDTGRRHVAAVPRKQTERHHRARTTTPPTPRRATQVDAPARCGRDAVARPE